MIAVTESNTIRLVAPPFRRAVQGVFFSWLTIAALASLNIGNTASAAEPISIEGLGDGIRHWKNGSGTDGYPAS
jgi:hypothetical protein